MNGKCPKCDKIVTQARLEHMDISDGRMIVKAFSAACPYCNVILGTIVDPRPSDVQLAKIAKSVGAN